MDYNLHKSNSTYFSDMDISRTSLFTALIRNAIRKNSRLYGKKRGVEGIDVSGAVGGAGMEAPRGKHMIALGGITCLFKREVLPYQRFEMWTRLLCWDQKWFYLVTHLVKPGFKKPTSWTLQPWKKAHAKNATEEVDKEKLKGAIYATALAKYVIKKGRITVKPEQALFDADMVPAKPEGWVYTPKSDEANGAVDGDAVLPQTSGVEWNWDIIEEERLRGLRFAENFVALDGLHDVFDGGREGVLGEYADLLFV
ncbi:hypothetical protein K504DRAFT_465860 [Pleomassaria siparia CBS 279.74]|uniref:Capsule polysaccharide biosynthesis protein n=1 Tax=Pleomassaria siparia CBS 279.74 TaxID=1314801 RepID=A0A6G1KDU8_9PLEO|nr:hypothetical protein K504DRAFT_465860 [Pleomassaria siparia CBS 279.74]